MEYLTCGGPGARGAQLPRAPPPWVPSSGSRPPSSRNECAAAMMRAGQVCWQGLAQTSPWLTMRVSGICALQVSAVKRSCQGMSLMSSLVSFLGHWLIQFPPECMSYCRCRACRQWPYCND